MKIAICLYGQPRDYKHGHECISNLIKENNENTYDFFFHCWIDDNIKYECSPWREIDEKTLVIENQNDVKNEISQLYKPISYLYEKPLDKTIDSLLMEFEYIKESLAYVNSSNEKQNNIYNTFSQIYSRNKVKDLFEKYITDTKTNYDMVISTRFDGLVFPKNIKIAKYNKNKIYASSSNLPRYIIPDNFLIIPPEIYINWFNLYKNIKNMINNTEIEKKINDINETLEFNMENLLLSNYLLCGYTVNNIEYILI
jgi:hypothetical protein